MRMSAQTEDLVCMEDFRENVDGKRSRFFLFQRYTKKNSRIPHLEGVLYIEKVSENRTLVKTLGNIPF